MIKKIRKTLIAIGTFLITLPGRTFASVDIEDVQTVDLYGVVDPTPRLLPGIILSVLRNLILPIVLIVGIVVYIKKSKSSKKRKILTILAIVAIAIAIFFLLTHFINVILLF